VAHKYKRFLYFRYNEDAHIYTPNFHNLG
jgi:hypothetical protein